MKASERMGIFLWYAGCSSFSTPGSCAFPRLELEFQSARRFSAFARCGTEFNGNNWQESGDGWVNGSLYIINHQTSCSTLLITTSVLISLVVRYVLFVTNIHHVYSYVLTQVINHRISGRKTNMCYCNECSIVNLDKLGYF